MALPALTFAETLTIGTVSNGDMLRMQKLSGAFEAAYPDITLEWQVLDENTLRQNITRDIAAGGGEYDVITIGMYEAPIWGGNDWLVPMEGLPGDYDVDDIFDSVKGGLSANGKLYALPFYAESSMTMYRKDLFEKVGMPMPANPTWQFMYEAASKIHDPANEVYGACLRGKAGWGENVAFITTMANSFGAQWFDMNWEPQFDSPEWDNALSFYLDLMSNYGPPQAYNNGFSENLALMNAGKCGFWVDATVAGSFVTDPGQSSVADHMAFAPAPYATTQKGSGWLWAWALAVPVSSDSVDAAKTFITWATSKEYSDLVAQEYGIANIPPGTRKSTYANAEYMAAASFAQTTLDQMAKANPEDSTLNPNPYTGVQFVTIPKFQSFANKVGQQFSGALSGKTTKDKALELSQKLVRREMVRDGYIK
nr:sugar ABC transporter substrate-binding protein [Reinekea marinisedimentorum]